MQTLFSFQKSFRWNIPEGFLLGVLTNVPPGKEQAAEKGDVGTVPHLRVPQQSRVLTSVVCQLGCGLPGDGPSWGQD